MATFTRFSSDDIVITTEKVFTNTWSNNTNELTSATDETSSLQAVFSSPTSSGNYYIDVYNNADPDNDSTAEVQYSISYGHRLGSGSEYINDGAGAEGYNASRAIYSQYRSLVFGDETRNFSFNGHTPDDIFIININRARYKQSLRLGSLNLKIGNTKLTDDSVTNSGAAILTNAGRQYNIVSGSSGTLSGSNLTQVENSGSFGLFYPDAGFLVLNADAVNEDSDINITVNRNADTLDNNHVTLLNAIDTGGSFILDTQENISSQFYFVRAKNKEFNYTTNPSFIDANGNLNFTSMVDNPVSYITTVGLYNDANELLAVAKLSQPIAKDFTKEALIKVKLDY
jgi:hypothetical protein